MFRQPRQSTFLSSVCAVHYRNGEYVPLLYQMGSFAIDIDLYLKNLFATICVL